ncbi:MAG TPA: DUF2946 family protein [Caldimonas sp.]|jgi:hypothetical protein|nr:DUF2946 family protein [Caldimonas sp.]
MDEIVAAALRKWPNVPHCYGWLALDARGDWYMRDARIQAAGPFPRVKGSRIDHEKLREFIGRNYAADTDGAWFFQNGPQRVYVELEAAPWVWRLQPDPTSSVVVTSHTGLPAAFAGEALVDESGRLFLVCDLGIGIVHTLDMQAASDVVERGSWRPREVAFDALVDRFGVRLSPAAAHA